MRSYCQNIFRWRLMTSHDLTAGNIAKFASKQARMVMTDVIHGRDCYYNEYLKKWTSWIPPHWLMMRRSRNWPDLRSSIKKRDIQVVGSYMFITCCNFNPITGGLYGVRYLGGGVSDSAPRQISRTNRLISMGRTPFDSSHRELSESL